MDSSKYFTETCGLKMTNDLHAQGLNWSVAYREMRDWRGEWLTAGIWLRAVPDKLLKKAKVKEYDVVQIVTEIRMLAGDWALAPENIFAKFQQATFEQLVSAIEQRENSKMGGETLEKYVERIVG